MYWQSPGARNSGGWCKRCAQVMEKVTTKQTHEAKTGPGWTARAPLLARHLFERTAYAKLAMRALFDPPRRRVDDAAPEHPLLRLFFSSQPTPEDGLRKRRASSELKNNLRCGRDINF